MQRLEKGRERIIEEKYVRGAPDLVVEVRSPTHLDRDRVVKKKLYHKFGLKEYCVLSRSLCPRSPWGKWVTVFGPMGGHFMASGNH
ncbi:MAG: Uma2 family endonuclease, partial [Nitrospirae bacterium]|nr:Uma2 family endonuclease [Nitrospirota bacterium]